jgi:adenylate kinase family enzyme
MKDKILVIGCCGAGKTKLAKQIAETTKLPLIHLDKEYYKPNWERPFEEDWKRKVIELVSAPRWIMDGNYYKQYGYPLIRSEYGDIFRYKQVYLYYSHF